MENNREVKIVQLTNWRDFLKAYINFIGAWEDDPIVTIQLQKYFQQKSIIENSLQKLGVSFIPIKIIASPVIVI